jgi:hypothetical protein
MTDSEPYYPWANHHLWEYQTPYYRIDVPITHVYRIYPPGQAGASHLFPSCGASRFGFDSYEVKTVWTLWPRTLDPYAVIVEGDYAKPETLCGTCRKGWDNGRRPPPPPEPAPIELAVTGRTSASDPVES